MASAPSLKKQIHESAEMQKLRKKRMRVRRRITIIVSVCTVVFLTGLVFASRIEKIRIREVTVSGNQIIDTEDVVSIVQANISGMYAYVIPRNNAFLYPKKSIERELVNTFPRFNYISVSLEGTKGISVTVEEERGTALWCGSDGSNIADGDQCYFTDTAGVVIDKAPYYSGNVYYRFYGGEVNIEQSILGQSFLPSETYSKIMEFADGVEELGLPIYAIRVDQEGEYVFLLDLGGSRHAPFRFRSNADFPVLLANLSTALERSDLRSRLAKEGAFLQYFDLRFSNKVYYKFSTPSATVTPKE